MRYEKRAMTQNSSIKQENEPDVICMYSKNETMYVCDYLEDIPDTERKKEDNAPKLSSRFLRESVNAEQRRLIVGYMIRLGVSVMRHNYGFPIIVCSDGNSFESENEFLFRAQKRTQK